MRRQIAQIWQEILDWWSFRMGTLELWLWRPPETPEDRAIREEGERIRKAFPWIDFDHPGRRSWTDSSRSDRIKSGQSNS